MKGDHVKTIDARFSLLALGLALMAGACSPSTGGTGSTAPSSAPSNVAVSSLTATIVPTPSPTAAPTATPAPTEGGVPGPKATPGSIDPCTLLTVTEASAIIGMKVSAGVSDILDPDRVCTFRSGLSEVKLILAPPAPDAATAQAYWDAERAQAPAGVTVTDLTYFDRSAYVNGESAGVSVSALFVIQGNYFFDLFCGFPACTQAASVGGAQHIVGRLPG